MSNTQHKHKLRLQKLNGIVEYDITIDIHTTNVTVD